MAHRLHKTLIDYLVIAISPALIMTLIGSLIFFLLEVFYRGEYSGRLHVIFGCFIIGAVLVGRISIEEGWERAAVFAVALAVVTVLAVNAFVQFQGVPFSFLINCGLVALIWWCAHKLTWDCTVIDEQEPDSGEGLLEAIGLDEPAAGRAAAPKSAIPEEPQGTTARDAPPATWQQRLMRGWQRLTERSRRPHAPGLWVVYFSLAALPLFGIGQWFIPSGNLPARQYAFELLVVYVASGLGLLLTTSFLGLRRYLRQRRLEMPIPMVGVWLVIGGVLIVAAITLVMVLPRPNAEYAISRVPITISSPDRTSSRYAVGKEGVREDRPGARPDKLDEKGTLQSNQPGDKGQTATDQRDGKGAGQPDQQQGAKPASGNQAGKGQPQADGQPKGAATPSGQPQAKSEAAAGEPSAKREPEPGKPSGPSEAEGSKGRPDAKKPGGQGQPSPQEAPEKPQPPDKQPKQGAPGSLEQPAKGAEPKPPPKGGEEKTQQGRSSARADKGGQTSHPRSSSWMPKLSLSFEGWVSTLAKLLLYALLIALAIWWLRRHWAAVLAAIQDFLAGWRQFWASLFGRKREKAEAAQQGPSPAQPALPRFADFVDPFLAGTADQQSPAELVNYTFLALEAWAREHGCARQPDQTPHEFAWSVGQRAPDFVEHARRLADLYCRVAYAPGTLGPASVEHLRQFWQNIPQEAAAMQSPA